MSGEKAKEEWYDAWGEVQLGQETKEGPIAPRIHGDSRKGQQPVASGQYWEL